MIKVEIHIKDIENGFLVTTNKYTEDYAYTSSTNFYSTVAKVVKAVKQAYGTQEANVPQEVEVNNV